MKTKKLTAIAILTLTLIRTAAAYDLLISTNHVGAVFEGPPISETLQDFIVADVQRCYDVWGTNLHLRSSRAITHIMRIYTKVFGGPYHVEDLYDDDINIPRNITTNANNQLMLKFPLRLIQKYAEAYDFKTNNLNKVLAADAFVDFLSSPEFANVTSNQVSNYILYKDLPPEGYLLSGEGIVTDLTSQEFYRPSVLGFYYTPDGPAPTNLCALLPTITKERTPSSRYHSMPAIWHDGKWKISMWNWE